MQARGTPVSRLHNQQARRVRHFVTMWEKPVQQAIGQQDPLEKINAVHRDLLPCALLQFMFEYVSSDHGVMHELLLEASRRSQRCKPCHILLAGSSHRGNVPVAVWESRRRRTCEDVQWGATSGDNICLS